LSEPIPDFLECAMPVRFTRQLISSEPFESANAFDVDGDGVLDIVSGAFWYQGPDFRRRHLITSDLKRYEDYYDDFSTIVMDINGDGRPDFVTGGWWGQTLRWYENPGQAGREWAMHVIAEKTGNIETTRAWDIDGDGELEIVPNTPNAPLCAYKLRHGAFERFRLFDGALGHGLGFGDIDGDGRGEFITPRGILKSAGDPLRGPWELTDAAPVGDDASIPILVVDVNGDGLMDLIVGASHSYGLNWFEQRCDGGGKRSWHKHPIDPFNSQYHDLHWADIDNDGQAELITGKRYLAHCGRDPGAYDDLGIYYFKWTGEGFAKQVISHGPAGVGTGCGIHFALADLRKTGRLDVIAPGKDGLHVLFNEGE
jgi:hypothetical protein